MKLDIREIYDAARAAGFTPDQATTWTAIAMAESGGRTDAHNPNGEDSFGLWQINVAPGVRKNVWGDLDDPYVNARAAYAISNHGTDMRPWTTTHASNAGSSADYRTYLGEVSAVTGFAGDDRGVEGYSSPLPDPLPPSSPATATSYDVIDLGAQPGSDLDTDHDGLTDAFEARIGSNPELADTDGDGLSDAYEAGVSHTDPLLADTDGDTLTDSAEVALGTSPTSLDTDQDGLSDGLEIRSGYDPLAPQGDGAQVGTSAMSTSSAPGWPTDSHGAAASAVETATAAVAPPSFRGGDPWAKVSVDGETVDNFTAAALQVAGQEAGTHWHILQGSFSTDVAASGSTHAGGGVVDVAPTDGDWEGAVTALRKIGFAAWIRNVPGHAYTGSGAHIHAVLIGDEQMSHQAALQVQDYLNDDNGLEGSAPDDGPRQFVHNRFSWDGAALDPTATVASYDQIDAGARPGQVSDTDGDGLTDAFERAHGLDPLSADTDHDGRGDGMELLSGTSPLVADATAGGVGGIAAPAAEAASLNGLDPAGDDDGDHLSNAFEIEHGLDPRSADTDHDGLTDATELALGTDPTAVDSDLDGFTDHAELQFGTDPLVAEPNASGALDPGADPMSADHLWPDLAAPDGGTDAG
ncbi:MAG: hypothetical protein WB797_07960 [Nocardioides sp.]